MVPQNTVANIDPRMLALGTDATPMLSGVTAGPPGLFYGCRDSGCKGGQLPRTHLADADTTTSGANLV
jgi:hypothetical protein